VSALVIGIDPGLTTGLFAIAYATVDGGHAPGPIAAQIHGSEGVIPFVQTLLTFRSVTDPMLAVEQFIVGTRAARSSSAHAGRITRALIAELSELAHAVDCGVFTRSAAMVKPWATDKRLEAAGLLTHCVGMQHARDAARHALYAAVHCGITADPLSKAVV
jgi:hypothetical protein